MTISSAVRGVDPILKLGTLLRCGLRRGGLVAVALLLLGACAGNLAEPPATAQGPDAGPFGAPLGAPQIDRFGRTVAVPPARVALLLPLSGRGADVGPAMLNAAQMALFDAGVQNFELLPRDTQGTPEGSAAAAEAALAEGAQLILGPLFSEHVAPVRTVAQSAGVNVIAFTNDRTVAGGNVLVMGFLPGNEVRRVIGYGIGQGLTRYAVLAPDSAYGRAVAQALEETALSSGAGVGLVQYYNPNSQDYGPAVQALAADGPAAYDAILLPAGGLQLRAIAPLLPYYGIEGAQLLGTSLWDEAELGREPVLVGGWFAAPDPEPRRGFEERYRSAFGAPPPALATLAYDAVALAARLTGDLRGPRFDTMALTDPNGFPGVNGLFRFTPEGLVQRSLAIIEVTPNGTVVRDPAPQSFADQAF